MDELVHANCLFLKERYSEAFDAYMQIINDRPDAIAASNLGYMYHRGIAVAQDYRMAMEFYIAACEDDGGAAYFNMALLYLRGLGVTANFKKAVELMRQSADHGCAEARLYLGLAYLLGYAYDPAEIECVTLIPFYRVIYRDAESTPLLESEDYNNAPEKERYAAIDCDTEDAFDMYRMLVNDHKEDPYAERQAITAKLMMARFYIDGITNHYNPKRGYLLLEHTAIHDHSREAAQFLLDNKSTAKMHKINVPLLEALAEKSYFHPIMGKLTNPQHHTNALLSKGKK